MADGNSLKQKLYSTLKLSGYNVRREFCSLIIDKFLQEHVDLSTAFAFDTCIKNLTSSLESQCLLDHSIEKEHIDRALETCLNSGYSKNETIFNVISAFDFPQFVYNIDRKQYFHSDKKPSILAQPDSKSQVFLNRYEAILQRTRRNFRKKINDRVQIQLQTIDFLLTSSKVLLNHTLVLGSLLQVAEGKFFLEDPTGMVQLDLTHAVFHGGFFVENSFVLANGVYDDKMLKVSTIVLPPGEEYDNSKLSFGSLNYFGGDSKFLLRESVKLREHLHNNPDESMMFFANLWLDHPLVFDKLEVLFEGLQECPPIAFVFMGNFTSESFNSETLEHLRKLFKKLGDLIYRYPSLVESSSFVFVPGLEDPCTSHVVPRLPLPSYVSQDLQKLVPKAIFTTNPCRIQYCTRQITLFRADLLPKMLQGSLYKPPKVDIADNLTRTLLSQGHLSPLPLNALTVHWDFDYTLNLFPLPDLVVVGDKAEIYQGKYKNCQVINPGSFCESGFQFKAYNPCSGDIEDCVL